MISKGGRWRFFKKGADGKKIEKKQAPKAKEPRFFDDLAAPKKRVSTKTIKTPKLRSAITPGSVLVILAGRFRGTRVVFLKQLPSGLLLVTGPYKINGVPLRRVNQAYVIATSTKVDISKVQIPGHIDDKYFARPRTSASSAKGKEQFIAKQQSADGKKAADPEWIAKRQQDQKAVDTAILAAVESVPLLSQYIGAKFTLTKHEAPHKMAF
jgi:large subunit ribosomal protein L6e